MFMVAARMQADVEHGRSEPTNVVTPTKRDRGKLYAGYKLCYAANTFEKESYNILRGRRPKCPLHAIGNGSHE